MPVGRWLTPEDWRKMTRLEDIRTLVEQMPDVNEVLENFLELAEAYEQKVIDANTEVLAAQLMAQSWKNQYDNQAEQAVRMHDRILQLEGHDICMNWEQRYRSANDRANRLYSRMQLIKDKTLRAANGQYDNEIKDDLRNSL
jgi:hypothetical protein